GPELAIELGEQPARGRHDVVDPARHRADLAQALRSVVEPIPQVADTTERAIAAGREHLEPALDLRGRHEARVVVVLAGQTHAVRDPRDAALDVAVDARR